MRCSLIHGFELWLKWQTSNIYFEVSFQNAKKGFHYLRNNSQILLALFIQNQIRRKDEQNDTSKDRLCN